MPNALKLQPWTSVYRCHTYAHCPASAGRLPAYCSNAKMRFQSFFMLMTVQPCFFASS